MPQPAPSANEQRLASFCRFFGAAYFALALCFALFPGLTFEAASLGAQAALGAEALFWNASAAGLMVALGTGCFVVAARPRERRHAVLPIATALLATSALSALRLGAAVNPGRRALYALFLVDAPVFLLTVLVYRAAATGVHSAPARELPPPPEPAPGKVQLGAGAPK